MHVSKLLYLNPRIPDKRSTAGDDMEVGGEITPENTPLHSAFGADDSESEIEDEACAVSSSTKESKPKGKWH